MKNLIINTPKGVYSLEVMRVAEDRAEHYSEVDSFSRDSIEWNEEVNYLLEDGSECIDWVVNNTDFEDWEPVLTKVSDEVKTQDEFFWFDVENFMIT